MSLIYQLFSKSFSRNNLRFLFIRIEEEVSFFQVLTQSLTDFSPFFGSNYILRQKISRAVSLIYSMGVFLNFRKAFDTVDHGILIPNLQSLGIHGNGLGL